MKCNVTQGALDGAEQDLRDSVGALVITLRDGVGSQGRATLDVWESLGAVHALHRRAREEMSEQLDRALALLRRARDFDALTSADRAGYQDDVDELVAGIRGEATDA
jgi:hypothetical protein